MAEAVLRKRGAVPSVGALVPDVRGGEVDEGELVQRQPVGRRDLVVVARDLSEVLDVGPHRVAVLGIRFGVIPVDHARRLPDEGGGPAGVVQLEALGHIVLDDVIPVPVPLLEHLRTDKHPRLDAEQLGGVVPDAAGLIGPVHAHVDGDLLQPGVEVEVGEPAEGLGAPEEGERLDFLGPVGKVVTDAPAVLPADVELGVDVALVVLRVGEVGAEVARVEEAQEAAAVSAPFAAGRPAAPRWEASSRSRVTSSAPFRRRAVSSSFSFSDLRPDLSFLPFPLPPICGSILMLEKLMLRMRLICWDFFSRSRLSPASAISTSGDSGSNCGVDTVSLYPR